MEIRVRIRLDLELHHFRIFEPRGTYGVHLRLIGKHSRLPISVI